MKIETKCVQSGYKAGNGEPNVLPIYQSTTFQYDSTGQMADLFDLKAAGHLYSRISNPTLSFVEEKLADLEGGSGALLTSSGQAAALIAVTNICGAGDHVVSSSAIYGGVYNLFGSTLSRLGIEFTFISPDASEEELGAAFRPNTKALYAETLSNPSLVVLDIDKFSRAAKKNNVPLIVDNTFPTPILCRPFEHGADIVIHSASKYMDGHASTIAGVIIDGGSFNWNNGKFPGLTEPDESYHGVVYTKDFGKAAYITKARTQLMRDYGACLAPLAAFILNLGLESLHVRMERHSQNALTAAQFLESEKSRVAWVNYPALKSNKYYELSRKYLPDGASGVVSFGIKGGAEAGKRFIDKLRLIKRVTHVADARTCALHPATTTHRQMDEDGLRAAGVGADLIRLSVGIEHIDDIIGDIKQALS